MTILVEIILISIQNQFTTRKIENGICHFID